MEFLTQNWELLTAAFVACMSVLNAFTKHYSTSGSVVIRVLGRIVEWASVFVSKDVLVGKGPLQKVKLPGQDVK